WLPENAPGHSVEGLVNQVLMGIPPHRHETFLHTVRGYAGGRLDIDSSGVAGHHTLKRPFVPTFERLYDMSDDRIRVPGSKDIAAFDHVITDTARFEIQLPE